MLCAGALIPRRLVVDGAELIIENGVGCDMLSSGMIELTDGTPTREILRLTPNGFNYIVQELGADFLINAGILLPELEKR